MIRILDFSILPKGETGWFFPKTQFGKTLTQLWGPNGTGKTVVVELLVFGLGHSVEFREQIYDRCSSVELSLEIDRQQVAISRRIQREFFVQIEVDGQKYTHTSEATFSEYLFGMGSFAFPTLVDMGGKPSHPYMTTLLPLIYLNQDSGYSEYYVSPKRFLRNQQEEMIRIFMGIAPRNNFELKKRSIALKNALEECDKNIVTSKSAIENLRVEISGTSESELDSDLERYRIELEALKSVRDIKADSGEILGRSIADDREKLMLINNELRELNHRLSNATQIESDIDVEIETLSLNSEAKNIFQSFAEICENPNCGLFNRTSTSYGKSLLYLKDQMKDLESGREIWSARISYLENERDQVAAKISISESHLRAISEGSEVDALVNSVGNLTLSIHEASSAKQKLVIFRRDQDKFFSLLNRRSEIADDLAEATSNTAMGLRYSEIRTAFQDKMVFWLDVLRADPVPRNIALDSNFVPSLGNEPLTTFHGSTRARILLAHHTALVEVQTEYFPGHNFPLILDTPRQHEIEIDDLKKYFDELKRLCERTGLQVVFSTTEFRYEIGEAQAEWTPEFLFGENKMYLGAK